MLRIASTKGDGHTVSGDEDYDLKYAKNKAEPFLTLPCSLKIE
jgi:hypothetical protein